MNFHAFAILAVLTGLFSAPALAKEGPVVLAPTSSWQLDFAEENCRLARTFGSADDIWIVYFTQHGPSESFELTLAGPGLK
ncbi:MAG: hypothetical protein ACR2FJ_01610 [Qipengyuania sp.]